jgi:hypothetical protein
MTNENPIPDEHMLTQPFLTEDGFVNPACMSELAAAIANMPRVHDRCANEPEWNTPRWTTRGDIVGSFAKYACRQSPYGCPSNLENVVKFLDAALRTAVKWDVGGMALVSLCDVSRLLYGILYEQGVSQFDDWNRRKREPTDAERMGERADPDTDFIDLDALLTNV